MTLLNSWFGQVALMGLTFCLFYHLANGVRHLFWDTGRGFSLPVAYLSGWIVVASSITLTIALWIFK